MRYSLSVILSRIRRSRRLAALMAAGLCFGSFFLFSALHLYVSLDTQRSALLAKTDRDTLRISIADTAVRSGQFSFAQYRERIPHDRFSLHTRTLTGATLDGMPLTFALWCMPEAAFRALFGMDAAQAVFCSDATADAIANGSLRIFCQGISLSLSADTVTVGEPGTVYPLRRLPPSEMTAIARDENAENDLPIDTVLLFPEEAGVHFQGEPFLSYQIDAVVGDEDGTGDAYAAAVCRAYEAFGEIPFSIDDPTALFALQSQTLSDTLAYLAPCAAVLFCITAMGAVGILYLLLASSRRYEIAVTMTVGNTVRRARAELIAEVGILTAVGCGGGLTLSVFLCRYFTELFPSAAHLLTVPVYPARAAVPLCILFSITVTAAVVCMGDFLSGEKPASTILRNERT